MCQSKVSQNAAERLEEKSSWKPYNNPGWRLCLKRENQDPAQLIAKYSNRAVYRLRTPSCVCRIQEVALSEVTLSQEKFVHTEQSSHAKDCGEHSLWRQTHRVGALMGSCHDCVGEDKVGPKP